MTLSSHHPQKISLPPHYNTPKDIDRLRLLIRHLLLRKECGPLPSDKTSSLIRLRGRLENLRFMMAPDLLSTVRFQSIGLICLRPPMMCPGLEMRRLVKHSSQQPPYLMITLESPFRKRSWSRLRSHHSLHHRLNAHHLLRLCYPSHHLRPSCCHPLPPLKNNILL